MGKLERHVRDKLVEWTDAGLITPEQSAAIRAREAVEKPGVPWGILIFAGFGAVVLGLGVILLFAYNWDKMPKFAKLGIIFGAMAAAHGAGMYLRRRESPRGFAEPVQLLGTMLFGAGIWLVAQIYHISAHYPNAFVVWAVAALLLAWALPSVGHGLLAGVLLAIWGCSEAISFGNHLAVAPLLVAAGIGWLAWRLRSPVLLAASLISFAVSAAAGFSFGGDSVFLVLLAIPVLYGSLGWLARGHRDFSSAHAILGVIAMTLYFPLLFILTFHDAAEELLDDGGWLWLMAPAGDWLWVAVLPLLALGLAVVAVRRAVAGREQFSPDFLAGLVAPASLLLLFFAIRVSLHFNWGLITGELAGVVVAVAATVIFLCHTVASLWIGCRMARLGLVAGGSLLMAAWVFARYVDLFDSLWARGVMFVLMGAALFAVAILYHRQKKMARPAAAVTASIMSSGKEDN